MAKGKKPCVNSFVELYKNEYIQLAHAGGLKDGTTFDEYINKLQRTGEFDHKMHQSFLNFLSSILDVTIIKPLIEMYTGFDMRTDEDLTDFDKGVKRVSVIFSAITIVTVIPTGGASQLVRERLCRP
ncbi:pre-toxin TG domain-containing protein [Bacillus pseudomycoides]|uniref:pre-toxin TG domain-containing protein n=1 Tax=Bacillus pseudomycoides TaxID=64104 RepID=UPI000BEC3132|nr:pre-toxin TG domain-containing protein [Bacillus pseudomycoides]MED1619944.1 pre-toxin TG domain-containing protein [Bacillus pseudomycoides]PDZ08779.1 hypothetical protein CON70_25630 [Bacillus pseudomycoides]PEF21559.1 hypothetical protein CON69_27205 [Bacillus pseudomycoides]PEP73031.1 hypothetical protein CN584_28765 [Bacillus pseudomycoides]PGD69421.1 hypothetical protein COM46_29655 [Bacillus pseudomycoides]